MYVEVVSILLLILTAIALNAILTAFVYISLKGRVEIIEDALTEKFVKFYIHVHCKKVFIRRLEMKFKQKVTVNLAILDRKGRPAKVDGVPKWSSSNEGALGKFAVAADGMSAQIESGETEDLLHSLAVEVDADRGEGVKPLIGVLALPITAEEATVVQLTATDAEDIPEEEPPAEPEVPEEPSEPKPE